MWWWLTTLSVCKLLLVIAALELCIRQSCLAGQRQDLVQQAQHFIRAYIQDSEEFDFTCARPKPRSAYIQDADAVQFRDSCASWQPCLAG